MATLPPHTTRVILLSSLKPADYNPRKISKEAMEGLKTSIKKFGLVQHIVVNTRTGNVVGGHQRVAAMMALGQTEAPVIEVDLSEAEEMALNITLNNPHIAGEFTDDLQALLDQLHTATPDLIDPLNLNDLWNGSAFAQGKTDPDDVPAVPKEPITKSGDLWVLGEHRLMCADSSDRASWATLMMDRKADLIFTSPPYNQSLDTFKPSGMQTQNPNWVNKMSRAYSDSMPENAYQDWQILLIDMMADFSSDRASFFYNHKIRYRDKEVVHPLSWIMRTKWKIRQEVIWDRSGSVTLNARMFIPCDERIYWLTKSEFKFNDTPEIKAYSSVWRIAPVNEIKSCSAPFPNELPLRGIQACSDSGDIVADPFSGTGTTLIAAERTSRIFRGMEIDPAYCDVICKRFQNFSGIEPVLINR